MAIELFIGRLKSGPIAVFGKEVEGDPNMVRVANDAKAAVMELLAMTMGEDGTAWYWDVDSEQWEKL